MVELVWGGSVNKGAAPSSYLNSQSLSNKAVYRTSPTIQGLVNIFSLTKSQSSFTSGSDLVKKSSILPPILICITSIICLVIGY